MNISVALIAKIIRVALGFGWGCIFLWQVFKFEKKAIADKKGYEFFLACSTARVVCILLFLILTSANAS